MLFWIQDAYTATGDYPYSEPTGFRGLAINYVRNSVKVVIDAYHGDVIDVVLKATLSPPGSGMKEAISPGASASQSNAT